MELTQANKAILQRNAEQVILGKKTNVLLVRDDVGHAKPTTRTLPENDFSFGKPEILPDRDTVRKGISAQQLQS
jgi:hypothetical protein